MGSMSFYAGGLAPFCRGFVLGRHCFFSKSCLRKSGGRNIRTTIRDYIGPT